MTQDILLNDISGDDKVEDCILQGKAKGIIRRILHDENTYFDVKTQKMVGDGVVYEDTVSNLIVDSASIFMARRSKPGTTWGTGIQFLAVGSGVGDGTYQVPEEAGVSQIALRQEIFRKAITSSTFLDGSDNATETPTNKIQMTTTFSKTEAVGAIVEQGLLAGDATTGSLYGVVAANASAGNAIVINTNDNFQVGNKIAIDGKGTQYTITGKIESATPTGTQLTVSPAHGGVTTGQTVGLVNGYLFNYHTEAVVNKTDKLLMTIVWVVIF